MKQSEKEASLRVLLAVARADGVVDGEERRTLAVVAAKVGVADTPNAAIDLKVELAKLTSAEARTLLLEAALAMANVDGCCSPNEYDILREIHLTLGADAPDIDVAQSEWASRMGEARQEIDRATAEFLRAVATLGDASDTAYERLVRELDAKKRDALREAVTVR